jgi:hypothetical protein
VFKHNVTYHDFNGAPHNEDLYFHMMVPEFVDLEFNATFGEQTLSDYIKQEMGTSDGRKVYTVFKLLVVNSYGRRSEDGARFIKKAEWTEEFLNSPAWEQFFLWLTEGSEAKNGQVFFNEIFPESMRAQVAEMEAAKAAALTDVAPARKALTEMSREELEKALANKLAAN